MQIPIIMGSKTSTNRFSLVFLFFIIGVATSCTEVIEEVPNESFKLDVPLELKVSQGEFGNRLHVTWVEVPLVRKYQVFRFDTASDSYQLIGESENSEFYDSNISEYSPYEKIFYKIRSFNSESEFSDFTPVSYGYFTGLNYKLDFEFGSQGTGDGQFLFPEHLSTDRNGNIYVSDPNTSRVQKFSSDGRFVEVFHTTQSPRGLIFLEDGDYILARSSDNLISRYSAAKSLIKEFGGFGTENGKFHYFRQIALDDENFLYVVDHNNHRIQKFDLQGNFVTKWGQYAEIAGNGNFHSPWGIVFYKGHVVVASQNKVQFFTKSGEFVKEFAMELTCYDLATDSEHLYIAAVGSIIKTDEKFEVLEKIGEGEFSSVMGVALGKNGELIGSNVYERKIRVYIKDR